MVYTGSQTMKLSDCGGQNICVRAKEFQTRILPSIIVSVFCCPRFQLNCNIVCSKVDNRLRTSGARGGCEKRVIQSLSFFHSFFPSFNYSYRLYIFNLCFHYHSLFFPSFVLPPPLFLSILFPFISFLLLSFPFFSFLLFHYPSILLFSSFQTNILMP